MNAGLFVLGILIIAGVFYFSNVQIIASLLSLQQFAYGVGVVFLVLGLFMPGGKREKRANKEPEKSEPVEKEDEEEEDEEEPEENESDEEEDNEDENEKKSDKYCGNCGAKITSDVKFCPKCGKKLGKM